MEEAIQLMVGVILVVFGLSYIIRSGDWIKWLKLIEHREYEAALPLGALNIMLGSLIVGMHWELRGWPLAVTIFGLLMIVKGAVYLLFPSWLPYKLRYLNQKRLRGYLVFFGIVTLLLGVGVLNYWYVQVSPGSPTLFDLAFGGPAL